jgi:HAD superfamily hydrolase (TIGR01509 family)
MERIRAVILDVDGTLVYSNDEHARAFIEAARELELPDPGFERVRWLIGKGGDKLIPEAFGLEEGGEAYTALDERKGEIFRERYAPTLKPTPGARELLERFAAEGLRRVVATSAGSDDIEILLERAGVTDLVEACTTASDVEETKPDPDIVDAALRLAEVDAGVAVMIGDTPYDVEAATRGGVRIVGVRSGGWEDDELRGAAAVYDHPADLLAHYERSLFGRSMEGR